MVSLYNVRFTPQAKSDLARLDRVVAKRALTRIRWLTENFDSIVPQPLTGQWAEYYKLRAGDYRIIYRIDEEAPNSLVVEFIRHRREAYK